MSMAALAPTTVRRSLSFGLAAVLTFAALLGLGTLERVFDDERSAAVADQSGLRAALERYATVVFTSRLQDELRDAIAKIRAAEQDPLIDDANLLLYSGNEQLLPRKFAFAPRRSSEATAIHRALSHDPEAAYRGASVSPWSERIRLLRGLFAALGNGNPDRIERSFRAVLSHRSHYVLRADRELTSALVAFERLAAASTPTPALRRGLLVEGLQDGAGGTVPGLARSLLAARSSLTESDFLFLAARIGVQLSAAEAAGDLERGYAAAFAQHTSRPAPPSVDLPAALAGPAILDGQWFVRSGDDGRRYGVRVHLDSAMEGLTNDMRAGGLLGDDDQLAVTLPARRVAPLSEIGAEVMSARWATREAEIGARYRMKLGLGFISMLLAGAVVGLGLLFVARRQRFVELKSDFVATVSHELRTPLASIRLMAETLERRLDGVEGARDYPSRIVGEVDGLGFLVENILSFNRLDKGGFVVRRQRVDLAPLIGSVIDDLGGSTRKPIESDTGDLDGLELHADPELVALLFANLVRNAAQYCTAPVVRIRVAALGETIEVSDNGVGIPPDQIDAVFDPFVRADTETVRSAKGSGLGLAICRRIMDAHDGAIAVARTGDEGTTFALTFPEAR